MGTSDTATYPGSRPSNGGNTSTPARVYIDGDMPIGGGSPVPLAVKMEAQVDRQSPKRLGPKATGP